MASKLLLYVVLAVVIVLPQTVMALPMKSKPITIRTSLAGDIDGIDGLAGNPTPSGEVDVRPFLLPWLYPDLQDELSTPEDGVFDFWVGGNRMEEVAWTQDGFQDFDVLAAFAVIGSAGWGGVGEAPMLQIEGHDVSTFQSNTLENVYTLNFFNLTPFAEYLEQETVDFSFDTPRIPFGNTFGYDEGALDFSAVFAFGRYNPGSPGPAPVPEPATVLLLGSGLLGAAIFRRRSK